MKISEETLLDNGYKRIDIEPEDTLYKMCDRFYQKVLPHNCCVNVYYYDLFTEVGALDYTYEFELYEEFDNYCKNTHLYGLNKEMKLEEVEEMLHIC